MNRKNIIRWINVVLRALMELGIVLAFGYWGFQIGHTVTLHILAGIFLPLSVFAFWGLVDFRNAGKFREFYRLIQELIISLLAAFALYKTGAVSLGIFLALLTIIYHALVYLNGEKILKSPPGK